MSTHTKGPWENEDFEIMAEDGSVICSVHGIDDFPCIDEDNSLEQIHQLENEFTSNARLIAAAPELLEACEKTLITLRACRILSEKGFDVDIERLEAAIAKAEGLCAGEAGE